MDSSREYDVKIQATITLRVHAETSEDAESMACELLDIDLMSGYVEGSEVLAVSEI